MEVFLGGRSGASSSSAPSSSASSSQQHGRSGAASQQRGESLPAIVLDILASVPACARVEGVSPEATDSLRMVAVKTVCVLFWKLSALEATDIINPQNEVSCLLKQLVQLTDPDVLSNHARSPLGVDDSPALLMADHPIYGGTSPAVLEAAMHYMPATPAEAAMRSLVSFSKFISVENLLRVHGVVARVVELLHEPQFNMQRAWRRWIANFINNVMVPTSVIVSPSFATQIATAGVSTPLLKMLKDTDEDVVQTAASAICTTLAHVVRTHYEVVEEFLGADVGAVVGWRVGGLEQWAPLLHAPRERLQLTALRLLANLAQAVVARAESGCQEQFFKDLKRLGVINLIVQRMVCNDPEVRYVALDMALSLAGHKSPASSLRDAGITTSVEGLLGLEAATPSRHFSTVQQFCERTLLLLEHVQASCAACGKGAEGAEGGKLMLCKACSAIRYCSRECQTSHWKQTVAGHKATCKVLAAANPRHLAESSTPSGSASAGGHFGGLTRTIVDKDTGKQIQQTISAEEALRMGLVTEEMLAKMSGVMNGASEEQLVAMWMAGLLKGTFGLEGEALKAEEQRRRQRGA
ncbi:hypothetical protein FOA52_005084 [Chlamydomonas sp. UWO 241]|nr:hypothetical protein FOA52_005084 [Chlamydomonas sp. UWO 241]